MGAAIFALIYTVLMAGFVGWRSDHTFMLALVLFMVLAHKASYDIVITLSAFIIFWVIYDSLRLFPNYLFQTVHVLDLYQAELSLFGVVDGGKKVILCEYFIPRVSNALSLFAGFSYILWMPIPLAYSVFLYFKDKKRIFDYTYGFLLTCFIGFVVYYIYPAAPPWYYLTYGDSTNFRIPGSEGLLSDFDRILGVDIFKGIYAKGGNVFCAVPSLHSAYPVITLYTAVKRKNHIMTAFFSIWALGTWFAAVYSQHHYVIDVLLGILCAIIAGLAMDYFSKFKWYQRIRDRFLLEIS